MNDYLIIILLVISCALSTAGIFIAMDARKRTGREAEDISRRIRDEAALPMQNSLTQFSTVLTQSLSLSAQSQDKRIAELNEQLYRSQDSLVKQVGTSLSAVEDKIRVLSEQNTNKLEQIRVTVDEKLQKTLDERLGQSFKRVSEHLEMVSRGIGEMKILAGGVDDLKKVLSNVKTRGILGEIQLGAILEDILAPGQYEKNAQVKKNSAERVEYAVKLPSDDGETVYIPIDSKFPGDVYSALCDAYESGNADAVKDAAAALIKTIKAEAKSIRDKYINPPNTTEFAIMFLPFEGLYAEAVNRGLLEILQREFRINIAGPSTMAAILNSLQMGFKTFAIQKRSGEVWKVLGEVKNEFEKFANALQTTQNRISTANKELDELIGTRANAMRRKLRGVESINTTETAELPESPDRILLDNADV